MADFLSRLRAKLEAMQEELAPEAGFNRRALGYDDEEGGEDATFEDAAGEDGGSPWRRETDDGAPPAPPAAGRAGGEEGSGTPPGTIRPRVRQPPLPRSAHRGERTSEGDAAASGAPTPLRPSGRPYGAAAGGGADPHPPEQARARAVHRARRIRARLRAPDSLRELFLLREVIDRPLALRGRRGARGE